MNVLRMNATWYQPPLGKIEESGQFVELTFILPTRGWKESRITQSNSNRQVRDENFYHSNATSFQEIGKVFTEFGLFYLCWTKERF